MSDSMNLTTSRSDEEWVTKKKVEITTTKNIETKVYRQLVLEDGTVIDEEVPTVTVDKTEDKQVFVTDHDEEREIKDPLANQAVTSAFPVNRGTHIGDKFTSVKTTKDVTENIRKTEAVQNIGNIRARVSNEMYPFHRHLRNFHVVGSKGCTCRQEEPWKIPKTTKVYIHTTRAT